MTQLSGRFDRNMQKGGRELVACASVAILLTGCSAGLPGPGALPQTTAAILAPNTNATVIAAAPAEIYQRIARNASQCWFGPFGSAYRDLITSVDVPPPNSSAPVSMSVHRRLKDVKTPWGPALMRVVLSGTESTSIEYQNIGFDGPTFDQMSIGFTRWANGSNTCEPLKKTDPKWESLAVTAKPSNKPK